MAVDQREVRLVTRIHELVRKKAAEAASQHREEAERAAAEAEQRREAAASRRPGWKDLVHGYRHAVQQETLSRASVHYQSSADLFKMATELLREASGRLDGVCHRAASALAALRAAAA